MTLTLPATMSLIQATSGHEPTQGSMPWPQGSTERGRRLKCNQCQCQWQWQCHSIHAEAVGSTAFRNVCILPHHYTATLSEKPRDLNLHRRENLNVTLHARFYWY